jgi:chromosome segregation ATPase
LQIEPFASTARVLRLVDGGLFAGAARRSGKIQPGDILLQVNGETVTSYDHAVTSLKATTVERTITFQRPIHYVPSPVLVTAQSPERFAIHQTPRSAKVIVESTKMLAQKETTRFVKYTPSPASKATLNRSYEALNEVLAALIPAQRKQQQSFSSTPFMSPSHIRIASARKFQEHRQYIGSPQFGVLRQVYKSFVTGPSPYVIGSMLSQRLKQEIAGAIVSQVQFDATIVLKTRLLEELMQCQDGISLHRASIDPPAVSQEEPRTTGSFDRETSVLVVASDTGPATSDDTTFTADQNLESMTINKYQQLVSQMLPQSLDILVDDNDMFTKEKRCLNDALIKAEQSNGILRQSDIEALKPLKRPGSQQVSQNDKELTLLQSKLAKYQLDVQKKDALLSTYRSNSEAYQLAINTLRTKVSKSDAATNELSNNLEKVKNEKSQLEIRLSQAQEKVVAVESNALSESKHLIDQVDCLRRELAMKQDYLDLKVKTNDQVDKEKELLKQSLRQALLRARELEGRDDSLSAEVENLQGKLAQHEALLAAKSQKADGLVRENAALSVEIARLETTSNDSSHDHVRLSSLLEECKGEIAALRSEACSRANQLSELKHTSEETAALLIQKDAELNEKQLELQSKDEAVRKLRTDLSRAERSLQARNSTIEEMRQSHVEECTRLQSLLDTTVSSKVHDVSVTAAARLVEARSEISDLQRREQALQVSERKWIRDFESVQKSNEDLFSQCDRLKQSLDEKENELSSKSVECMTFKSSSDDLRADLYQKQDELDACRRALDKGQLQYAELNDRMSRAIHLATKENEGVMEELLALQEELTEATSHRSELEKLLRSMRRNQSESDDRIGKLREQLEREREAAKNVKRTGEAARESLQQCLNQLREEFNQQKTLYTELKSENEHAKTDSSIWQRKFEELRKESDVLRSRLVDDEAAAMKAMATLEAELSHEKEKAMSLSDQIMDLNLGQESMKGEFDLMQSHLEDTLRHALAEADEKQRKHELIIFAKEEELRRLAASSEALSNLKDEVSRLEESLWRAKEDNHQLNLLMEELKTENKKTLETIKKSHQRELERIQAQKGSLEEGVRKSEEKLVEVEEQLCATEEGFIATRHERERLILQKRELHAELRRAEDTILTLRAEIQARDLNTSQASDDSTEGEYHGMSRSDLKSRCDALRNELQSATSRVYESETDNCNREEKLKRFEQDLELMSNEIQSLVHINEQFEVRVAQSRALKQDAELAAASMRKKLDENEELVTDLKSELMQSVEKTNSLASTLTIIQTELEQKEREFGNQLQSADKQMELLKRSNNDLKTKNAGFAGELEQCQVTLEIASRDASESRKLVSSLEAQLYELREELAKASKLVEELRHISSEEFNRLRPEMIALEDECTMLQSKVAELEAELATKAKDLESKSDHEQILLKRIQAQREEIIENEALRESVVAKLTEAARVVMSQKESISSLEQQAAVAQTASKSLSNQVEILQSTIQKIEAAANSSTGLRSKQIKDLDDKCVEMEKERAELRQNVNALQDELRVAHRRTNELELQTAPLESRLEAMKEAHVKAKSRLSEALREVDESRISWKQMEAELESERMQTHHLKAKVQLVTANLARMKSDNLLHHETDSVALYENQRVEALRSDIEAKTRKLESLSELYRSQKELLHEAQKTEDKLLRFVEEAVYEWDNVAEIFSSSVERLGLLSEHVDLKESLLALNFSGLEQKQQASDQLTTGLESLHSIIPRMMNDLGERRAQIQAWKQQRMNRFRAQISTPPPKSKAVPTTPSIMEALEKIKCALHESVLSPHKSRHSSGNQVDADYFHQVIQSLEIQIDGFLEDLKSANDALQAKDLLFDDLEQLVSHHQSERDTLEKKLNARAHTIRDLEKRLQREMAWKRETESELSRVRAELTSAMKQPQPYSPIERVDRDTTSADVVAAGALLSKFASGREIQIKARAFYHWNCHTAAVRATEQQGELAVELAAELTSTREKLSVLKRHFQKKYQSPSKAPGLDRIAE